MPKAVGRPKKSPKRVTLSLAAHHAAELEQLAEAHEVKLSTFCANLLERYSMEDQGMLASEILKTVVVETVKKETAENYNRLRSLMSRTALEGIATRQMARMILRANLQEDKSDKYTEEAWQFAVHSLKNPTPAVHAAIRQLAESIGNDDPALLIRVNETMEKNELEVEYLKAQVQQLSKQQGEMMQIMLQNQKVMVSLQQKLIDTQKANMDAIERLEAQTNKKGLWR